MYSFFFLNILQCLYFCYLIMVSVSDFIKNNWKITVYQLEFILLRIIYLMYIKKFYYICLVVNEKKYTNWKGTVSKIPTAKRPVHDVI